MLKQTFKLGLIMTSAALFSCTSDSSLSIEIDGPSSVVVGECTAYDLQLVSGDEIVAAEEDLTVTVSLENELEGAFYSDSDCSSLLVLGTIERGESSLRIYYISNSSTSGRIEAGLIEVNEVSTEQVTTDGIDVEVS